jgi:UDP-N-acetylbacillosamine N-acetyltransferase
MKQKPLLIFGAGGHAKVVADLAQKCGREIVGFIDDVDSKRAGEKFFGGKILGGMDAINRVRDSHTYLEVIVAVGECKARVRIASALQKIGLPLATLLHPAAVSAADVKIGNGTVVVAGAILNAGSTIGDNVIINTGASVDHDCSIGNGIHIGPGARLGGNVAIGDESWIGIGAIIKDRVSIGASCVIGAGALVLKNVPDNTVAYGSPATAARGKS